MKALGNFLSTQTVDLIIKINILYIERFQPLIMSQIHLQRIEAWLHMVQSRTCCSACDMDGKAKYPLHYIFMYIPYLYGVLNSRISDMANLYHYAYYEKIH